MVPVALERAHGDYPSNNIAKAGFYMLKFSKPSLEQAVGRYPFWFIKVKSEKSWRMLSVLKLFSSKLKHS